jgi:N-acetylneuraminic acid mutarotase
MYDYTTNTWSVSKLFRPRTKMAGIIVNDEIFWAGGLGPWEEWESFVEIREHNTQGSASACLFQEKFWDHGKNGAAAINNKIVFFTGIAVSTNGYNTRFDIYDVNNYSWSVGKLPVDIGGASIFSYNNTIYIVGGMVNGTVSNQIWKLVF